MKTINSYDPLLSPSSDHMPAPNHLIADKKITAQEIITDTLTMQFNDFRVTKLVRFFLSPPMSSENETVGLSRKSRGFVDGCFDLMHSGHFNALRQAKSMNEI